MGTPGEDRTENVVSEQRMKEAPKDSPKKQGWKLFCLIIGMMLWVFASVVASQLVVGYILLWMVGVEEFSRPVMTAIYSALSYVVAMLLVIIVPPLFLHRRDRADVEKKAMTQKQKLVNFKELGLHDWPTWTDIGLAPVGYIVYLILAAGLVALFSLFPWFNAGEVQEVGFSYYVTGGDRLVAFLTLVVVAPIAEEIIFRGWLYGRMREELLKKFSNRTSMVISIFLVSLLFGIVHMQWNVGVNVFALSLVLCTLREITGTIHAGILLHMLKNGIAFYLLFVMGIG